MGYYKRLKDLKEDADLTQRQIAEIINVSVNHYGKYERGETDIPLEKAIMLADYYNVSLDYIAGRTNFKMGVNSPNLSTDEIELIKQYRTLTERSKGQHDVLIKQLINNQNK